LAFGDEEMEVIAGLFWSAALMAQAASGECQKSVALFESGRVAEAQRGLEAAVRATGRNEANSFCWKALGVVYASQGNTRAAEGPFGEACRRNPNEANACYYWARALYSLDRFGESIEALGRCPRLEGASWRNLTARGQALEALGRPEAEADLRQAVEGRLRDSQALSEPDPVLSLAAYLYRQGRTSDAATLLEQAPLRYGQLASFHYQRGRVLAQQGDWQGAVAALRRAVERKPDYSDAHGLLSRAYYRLGDAAQGAFHAAKSREGSVITR
jgi:tetratricopeptide (TPR) repeat protein